MQEIMSNDAISSVSKGGRPTLSHIAQMAGVSIWTVSQALRGGKSIGAETRSRILSIASEMGYRPNHAARALVSSRTDMVGIWITARSGEYSPYYAYFQYCLQSAARGYGYRCFVEDLIVNEASPLDLSHVMNWTIDGVILCDIPNARVVRETADPGQNLAMVSVGSWGVDTSIDHVSLNLYPGAAEAVHHLIASGCQRIAYVAPPSYDARFDAYSDIMRATGRREELIFVEHNNRASDRDFLQNYRETYGMPDGLFCHSDEFAMSCYKTLCDLGIKVPDEVCIVGCNGLSETQYMPTPISTIVIPLKEASLIAWEFLSNRIKNPAVPLQSHIITPQLSIRASSLRP